MKMNDTLLKMIIDWMFGWTGSDCPLVCRSGRSSSRGLTMIKPPPDMIAGYLSQSHPHSHHKSQLMRHKAFSFHSAHHHHPAAHKQRGALLLQQQRRNNEALAGAIFVLYRSCVSAHIAFFSNHLSCRIKCICHVSCDR